MKTLIKIFAGIIVACFATFCFTSCSKDTDPAETDLFIGTYKGSISYSKDSESISTKDGSVIVSKVGDTYSFVFSDKIPSLTGIKFEKKSDNTYISIGSGLTGITIDKSSLHMLVVKDGATWTANCSR